MNNLRTPSLTIFIGSWLTVNFVFLAGEIVLEYGALSGLLMIVSFVVAFLFVIPFLKLSYELNTSSLFHQIAQVLILARSFIINTFIWYLLLSYELIHLYYVVVMVIGLGFLQLYFVRKWPQIKRFIYIINGSLLFSLAILLPNNLYLQVGLETVYHNLLHYHPKTLHLSMEGQWYIFILLFIIFFINFMIHIPLLKQYIGEDFKTGIRKLFMGIAIIATLILAFSTVSIVAITQDIKADFQNATLLLLIEKQTATSFVFSLIFIIMCFLLLLELLISYHVFKSHLKNEDDRIWVSVSIAGLIIGFIAFVFHYCQLSISVLIIYIVFGIAISIIVIILLLFTFKRQKVKKI